MSILSKKDAFLLYRENTIDLKYINAKEYIDKIEWNTSLKKNLKKYIVIIGVIWYIASVFTAWAIIYPKNANASVSESFLSRFPEKETKVVWCYNDFTKKVREGTKCTQKWDKNISLPPQDQIKVWLKYFTEQEIINRLGIVNFESNFNENAKNSHAIWYVQTLRSHWVAKDIDSQLKWLSDRQREHKKVYSGKSKRCGYYWENNNEKDGFILWEYWVLACLYRYHYHATKGTAYAERGIEATLYYKWYMYGYKGKDFEEYKEYLDIKL